MPGQPKSPERPKEVVYLWGAGATQAEITYLGAANVNLLMNDSDLGVGIATRVVQKLAARWRKSFASDKGVDIEKLISLLATSSAAKYHALADRLREHYFSDICERLSESKVLPEPRLAIGLFELHNSVEFQNQEVLTGIITTNHDGLLQVAAQRVHGHVNLGVPFESTDLTPVPNDGVPVVQLHGSFTWAFGLPIRVTVLTDQAEYSPDAVWIPPAILKESKDYPFNRLAGLAYELLSRHCDVLRVVGSSLTQNDWNVLSMIFNAQRHKELSKEAAFRIELIMPPEVGHAVATSCSYLRNLTPIDQLTEGDFSVYSEGAVLPDDAKNALFYWLKEKSQFHRRLGHLGTTALPAVLGQVVGEIP